MVGRPGGGSVLHVRSRGVGWPSHALAFAEVEAEWDSGVLAAPPHPILRRIGTIPLAPLPRPEELPWETDETEYVSRYVYTFPPSLLSHLCGSGDGC